MLTASASHRVRPAAAGACETVIRALFCNQSGLSRWRECRRWNANEGASSSLKLRDDFGLPPSFDLRRWYPMHMSVQLAKMEGKLRTVDLIIEVHDARIPITGRNPDFYSKLYAVRPHILVLNKMDLINLDLYRKPVEDYYHDRGVKNIVWTNCRRRDRRPLRELREKMTECLQSEPRFNRTVKTEYQAMVIGIPNVGKSSLVNSLRSANLGIRNDAVAEGARPGVTIRVQNRVRVLDRPPIYLVDTPGVLFPKIQSVHDHMKLALCNLILESATMPYYVADYLLFWMNRMNDFSYVDFFKLEGPSDDIQSVLLSICKARNLRMKCFLPGEGNTYRWNVDGASKLLIDFYRTGSLRDQCLDKDILVY